MSLPSRLTRLGLGQEDYALIAKNMTRVGNMGSKGIEDILERGNKELSAAVRTVAHRLPIIMAEDRSFYELAGLDYARGTDGIPQGSFQAALVDYLLRNRETVEEYVAEHGTEDLDQP